MVTRKDVALAAGVSEATVSRVLNGVGPMREDTKQRVLQVVNELNYHPNAIAQSFARRRSGNLGVILPYVPKVHLFSTHYFAEILSGIGEAVQQKGYDLLLLFRSSEQAQDYTSLYHSQKVDACIILGSSDSANSEKALEQLWEQKLPFCLVNQHFANQSFNEIDADHVKGSYDAMKHLLNKGYKRIAFLNGSLQYSNSRDRLEGYQLALKEEGLEFDEARVFLGNYSRTSGIQAAQLIYEQKDNIDAVFAANDRMAIGLMQGLRELGVRAGEDIAIVGYDDSDAAHLSDMPLTTVHVPFYEMGKIAAEKLLKQVLGEQEKTLFQQKLATKLVVRKSCGS
ncbi:LacI family transcriptional regulator [Paenibacillus psychroresistens]|uniref:LacI family transcriptional regulator n=1 Tax=Paenibacillus psychroresistens TaxID=1778678 RepID=A0A6B8REP4_9BACL|nr:LacI family DNA-binding transcriptional regulator [Paenibacillus psychroresistens]QGQ94640.1 LacI family transcriptional regulator [Paenibacillus psychroresistens]